MIRYYILENVENYDGLYVCYETESEINVKKDKTFDVNLIKSQIIATDESLEKIREYIPNGFVNLKGEKNFDPRIVEMWMNFI
jgi:hypothetical protein